MHVRSTMRLALMLLASLRRSPVQWVRVVLSLPARSTRDSWEMDRRPLSCEWVSVLSHDYHMTIHNCKLYSIQTESKLRG